MKSKWYLATLAGLAGIFADRLAKGYFVAHPEAFFNAKGIIWLQYYSNVHMALNIPLLPWLYYSIVGLILIILLIGYIRVIQHRRWPEYTILTFILIGAISNLVDRWLYGGVVDFIHIPLGSIFNLADSYIVVAIISWSILKLLHDHSTASKQAIPTAP